MDRKIIKFFLSTFIALLASPLFASEASYSAYVNYYQGVGLRNSGSDYSQVSLPLFNFSDDDLVATKFGKLATFCFRETSKCLVTSTVNSWTTIFASDDATFIEASANKLPVMPRLVFARVGEDTLQRMQVRSEHHYEWGDDKAVDDKWFDCGLAAGGCIAGVSTGAGAIISTLTCVGAAKLCTDAKRLMIDFEEKIRAEQVEEEKEKEKNGPRGEGGSSNSGPKGNTTTVHENAPKSGTRPTVTLKDLPDHKGHGGSKPGIIKN